ncbi:hypothetical protein CLAFUW4_13496 [Fulvia fulva]|uniref:Uncharacterized protein n=1 Tax=Passalora fulva TaxID=5499 RepID=A0A9Q8PK16_PASFU|nr:uncharacterized protein CLAFUR5_13348 [Fulvia fulva]KAK4612064.1 hypothetical protein CLAFUR4_13499 [Fulvia fulva]KAK4613125.1 hypothetical protein CLAFUR0_13507 [Fulvia fulva]UJO24074.1 hypothetical protein CLAFUR5_13348 [Fulvia fulva]WPV21122.1 hypothetical protein CLAFUW4_13496 [Fulvia fulva]WPV36051.1 hypothetical protein CLAFUW7_13503 [Fulvia fulva]
MTIICHLGYVCAVFSPKTGQPPFKMADITADKDRIKRVADINNSTIAPETAWQYVYEPRENDDDHEDPTRNVDKELPRKS